jgi:hypothetical protein
MEDATPVAPGTYSGSSDYAYAKRLDGVDYAGPALALVYGLPARLELGGETRLLTNPRLNARRGIGSGDLDVHLMGELATENGSLPAVAVRFDAILATGFASHGTNLVPELLVTKSFETFRLHANLGGEYIGSTRVDERRNRLFAVVGFDSAPGGGWNTDTLGMMDVYVRQSVTEGGKTIVGVELGVKRRIGMQSVFYAGLLSEVAGDRQRIRYRGLLGLGHWF